jgi:glycosyltransferase involved in cell wall biosynthesis
MITVVTPVFNGANFIEETINSVLACKGVFDLEYIVVDDGSTDSTPEILLKFGSAIKVINKLNGGESSAVNVGIQNAKGEIILIVSADDPLPSCEIFNGAERYFLDNPEIVAWYPNWSIINSSGEVIRIVEVEEFSEDSFIGRFRCLPGPGTLIRRESALRIGGRNTKWTFVGDYDFWLRLSQIGIMKKRDQLLAQWRFHDQSTSISRRGSEMATERVSVITEFVEANQLDEKLRAKALAHAYYFAARLSFFDSNIDGKSLLRKAFAANNRKIDDGKVIVYLFIWTLPFSRFTTRLFKPILRRMGRALT